MQTLGTQVTGRRQTKHQTQHKPHKKYEGEPMCYPRVSKSCFLQNTHCITTHGQVKEKKNLHKNERSNVI